MSKLTVKWVAFSRGREPQGKPHPRYPYGRDHDATEGIEDIIEDAKSTCTTPVRWPAKGCGFYSIACPDCVTHVCVTTTGRADDPRSVKIACSTIKP